MTPFASKWEDNQNAGLPEKRLASAWSVMLDELPESKDWILEIDSPSFYLTFRVADIAVVTRAVALLHSVLEMAPQGGKHAFLPNRDDIFLGYFGSAAVHLLCDNEDFLRCFLIIEHQSGSTLRINLEEDCIRALARAMSQAIGGLLNGGEIPQDQGSR